MLGIMGRGSRELRSVMALSWVTDLLLLELSPKQMSTQFSGRLYLSSKFFNLFQESFFPQRFVAMSASCCMILLPVALSSSKPLASVTGVFRADRPVADDCSVSSFRSSSSRSSSAWRLKSSSDGVASRALLEFERRGRCSCSYSDSSV